MVDGSLALEIPLKARISLSHAYFQHLANRNRIDFLHIKGYAFGTDTYPPQRLSSDVDLLVRPSHIARLMYLLQTDGWSIITQFQAGSIFEHAATVYHPSWGLADIHRYFPGVGFKDPLAAFDSLWLNRRHKEIAHFPCLVPSVLDSRILVVAHSARAKEHERADIRYLESILSSEDWAQMQERARELDAEVAFDTALGRLEKHQDYKYYHLWKSISEDSPAYVEWWGRLKRAHSATEKMRVIQQIFWVNEDHLAMSLGHKPSKTEIRDKFFSRFRSVISGGK